MDDLQEKIAQVLADNGQLLERIKRLREALGSIHELTLPGWNEADVRKIRNIAVAVLNKDR